MELKNVSFWDGVKFVTQAAAFVGFLYTLQTNQEHINKDLDNIKQQVSKIDDIKERVIILETKISLENERNVFSRSNSRKEFNSK